MGNRRRLVGVLPLAVILSGSLLAVAHGGGTGGQTEVTLNGGQLAAKALRFSGAADGAHGIIIEPFRDSSRNGFRVRQQAFGDSPIITGDTDCFGNFFANDVVCNGPRNSISDGDG